MTDTQKHLSKDHFTEKRFKPYNNASSYIKHLNNIYDLYHKSHSPDQAYSLSKKFQKQSPKNSDYKVSIMPRAHVSRELELKKELFNKFTSLDQSRSAKKRPYTRSSTPICKKPKYLMELSDLQDFRNLINSILTEKGKKCSDCHKVVCECVEKTKDLFLRKMMNVGSFKLRDNNDKKRAVFLTNRAEKYKGMEMEVDRDRTTLCSLFEDGSFMAIHSAKRNQNNLKDCKSDKKVKNVDKNLARAFAVTPIPLSDRRRRIIKTN